MFQRPVHGANGSTGLPRFPTIRVAGSPRPVIPLVDKPRHESDRSAPSSRLMALWSQCFNWSLAPAECTNFGYRRRHGPCQSSVMASTGPAATQSKAPQWMRLPCTPGELPSLTLIPGTASCSRPPFQRRGPQPVVTCWRQRPALTSQGRNPARMNEPLVEPRQGPGIPGWVGDGDGRYGKKCQCETSPPHV